MPITPEARALVRQIQKRGDLSETDLLEMRASLNEFGHIVGFDPLRIEPHRVPPDGSAWRWLYDPEHFAQWQQAKRLAAALDRALKANAQITIDGYVVAPSVLEVPNEHRRLSPT
jgi:hypothetical protein